MHGQPKLITHKFLPRHIPFGFVDDFPLCKRCMRSTVDAECRPTDQSINSLVLSCRVASFVLFFMYSHLDVEKPLITIIKSPNCYSIDSTMSSPVAATHSHSEQDHHLSVDGYKIDVPHREHTTECRPLRDTNHQTNLFIRSLFLWSWKISSTRDAK